LKLEGIPQISGRFRECDRYSHFEVISDSLAGKNVIVPHPTLAERLYEIASNLDRE
jgi:hypothetical protein